MLRRPFLIAATFFAAIFAVPAFAANPQVEFDTTAGKIKMELDPVPGTEGLPTASIERLQPSMMKSRLMNMPLEPIGDGRYVFRAGDGVLVENTGKGEKPRPVVVDLNVMSARYLPKKAAQVEQLPPGESGLSIGR